MKTTAKVYKGYGCEDLVVRREIGGGSTMERLNIDRTYYGPEWCEKHGMKIVENITADNGETFNVWKKGYELACAIPVKEG